VGDTVELLDVLLVADGEEVTIGRPTVAGARVIAEVVEHGRDKKIVVFKYKAKTRYRKKIGHRQAYTRLAIRQILTGREPEAVAVAEAPAKPRRRRAPTKRPPKAAAEVVAEAAALEALAEVSAEGVAEVGPTLAPEVTPPPAEAAKPPRRKARLVPPAAEATAIPEEAPKPRRRGATKAEKAAEEAAPKA
jgi:large subunit ribosomal protein L21